MGTSKRRKCRDLKENQRDIREGYFPRMLSARFSIENLRRRNGNAKHIDKRFEGRKSCCERIWRLNLADDRRALLSGEFSGIVLRMRGTKNEMPVMQLAKAIEW
jgi:hypothetical protein